MQTNRISNIAGWATCTSSQSFFNGLAAVLSLLSFVAVLTLTFVLLKRFDGSTSLKGAALTIVHVLAVIVGLFAAVASPLLFYPLLSLCS